MLYLRAVPVTPDALHRTSSRTCLSALLLPIFDGTAYGDEKRRNDLSEPTQLHGNSLLSTTFPIVLDGVHTRKISTAPLTASAGTMPQELLLPALFVVSVGAEHIAREHRRGRKRVRNTPIVRADCFELGFAILLDGAVPHLDRVSAFHARARRILRRCVLAVAGEFDQGDFVVLERVFRGCQVLGTALVAGTVAFGVAGVLAEV